MPVESDLKPSWAEQVEQGDQEVLPPSETIIDESTGTKTVTEYKFEDGKKIKVVRIYKAETRKLAKNVAKRKTWRKFGQANRDPPGPNPTNTVISEDIFMQFIAGKEQQPSADQDDDALSKLKAIANQKMVSCRICKGDHWTTRCPYKDSLDPQEKEDKKDKGPAVAVAVNPQAGGKSGKYVPPSLRGETGARKAGETMSTGRNEYPTIRVSNLSEDTREGDLQELFRPFGSVQRVFLAKDKVTGASKGFAFISYHKREDAAKAIEGLKGFGYDNLILSVEWSK